MAETNKLSVEKALNKLREQDVRKSASTRRDQQIDALDEETKAHESAKAAFGASSKMFNQTGLRVCSRVANTAAGADGQG